MNNEVLDCPNVVHLSLSSDRDHIDAYSDFSADNACISIEILLTIWEMKITSFISSPEHNMLKGSF